MKPNALLIRAFADIMAASQTKIDAPYVIIVSKFASLALAHDASVFQHIGTFCDREIATCGILIFGCFPTAEKAETLEQFLGIGFDILQAMCNLKGTLYRLFSNIAANWKLGFHITLDDYHIVAVHPDRLAWCNLPRHWATSAPSADVNYFALSQNGIVRLLRSSPTAYESNHHNHGGYHKHPGYLL